MSHYVPEIKRSIRAHYRLDASQLLQHTSIPTELFILNSQHIAIALRRVICAQKTT